MSHGHNTVAIDFDGVLYSYTTGWHGPAGLPDPPVEGGLAFVEELLYNGYKVVIHSSRAVREAGAVAIESWLVEHGFPVSDMSIEPVKPKAILYIDDRAFRFEGSFAAALDFLEDPRNVRPWNRKEPR